MERSFPSGALRQADAMAADVVARIREAGWRDEGEFDYAASTAEGAISVTCCRYVKAVAQ